MSTIAAFFPKKSLRVTSQTFTSTRHIALPSLPSALSSLTVGLTPTIIEAPEVLLRWPSTQLSRLPNGLTVATEELPRQTTSISLHVDVGSANETKENNGASNILKHLLFKGTQKRNQKQIQTDFQSLGGQFSAFSSRESTVFQASVLNSDAPKALELLADVVQNSSYSDEAVEQARAAALSELEHAESQRQEVVLDHLYSIGFQGTTLAQSALGTPSALKSLKSPHLSAFHRDNFSGGRIVLSVVGGAKHSEVLKAAQGAFTSLRGSSHNDYHAPTSRYTGSQVLIPDEHEAAAYCAFGFHAASLSDPDFYTFLILKELVGSWSTTSGTDLKSHLSEIISTEKLANSFSSFYFPHHGTGIFGLYTEGNGLLLNELPFEAINELIRISQQVTDSEVDHAKRKALTSFLLELDSSALISERLATQVSSTGLRTSPLETFKRVAGVSAADVRRVASKYIYDQDPVVVATGSQINNLPDYNQIRGYTFWKTL